MRSLRHRGSGWAAVRFAVGLVVLPLFLACVPAFAQQPPDAYIIKIDGPISEAYAKAVLRRLEYADEQGVETIILELDTPGGTIEDSRELADFIFKADHLNVIAYVNKDALSGGTMVALACKAIYVDASLGTIGDVAPVGPGGVIVGEKVQSPVREIMARYARARGYPEALVKAMVTKELEVWRIQTVNDPEGSYTYLTGSELDGMTDEQRAEIVSKKLIVAAGELLTMDAQRAVDYGFARKAVQNVQELYDELDIDGDNVQRLYLTGSERALTFLDVFSPLLIVAGFVLIFMELSHPGFGLPGILGIACFGAFFVIKWTLHYAQLLELLLFLAGVVLLLVEVFVTPGFGLPGVIGILLIFVSLVLACQQFGLPGTPAQKLAFQYNLLKVIGSFAAAGIGIAVLIRFVPSLPVLSAIVHRHDLGSAHAGEIGERRTPGLAAMAGAVGIALTALRPAGRADFDDTLLDVVTEGEFIEKGARVQIQEVRGNRVVVRRHSGA
ncbi:MAG: NfeD family protein [Planctomycetota bacterium]